MHDNTSKMLIGTSEQRGALYLFKGIQHEKAHNASGTCHLNLWHQRMGHPSLKITHLAFNVGNKSSELENEACDVCFRVKQTRDVFPLSIRNVVSSFDFIHYDFGEGGLIWMIFLVPCGFIFWLIKGKCHAQ